MARTILVLAANPKNTPQLRLDEEVREIDNGLERSRRRDEFTLKQKWAARPEDVRRAMLDFRPNIVHFCGHGAGEEGLAFEDDSGHAQLVNADALGGFFALFSANVECVVLNACYSEPQADAIANHIAYVIGMKREIGDEAAIQFAVAFYDALGAGESVEFAFQLARNAILWAGMPEHLTPVLVSRRGTGVEIFWKTRGSLRNKVECRIPRSGLKERAILEPDQWTFIPVPGGFHGEIIVTSAHFHTDAKIYLKEGEVLRFVYEDPIRPGDGGSLREHKSGEVAG